MLIGLLLLMLVAAPAAADWTRFRGPDGGGVATQSRQLPVKFGPGENVAWKLNVPAGKSSPVLSNGRIFLTGHEGDRLLTMAVDAGTGRVLWQRDLTRSRTENRHKLNDPAAPTPVTDGRNVYCFFPDYGIVSYSARGKERWRTPLGPHANMHGISSSPVWHADRVFVVIDQEGVSYVAALDSSTGKVVWKVERPPALGGSYSSPAIRVAQDGSAELLVLGSTELVAYSVATGARVWWVRGFPFQAKSSPAVWRDGILAAVRAPGGDGRMDLGTWEQMLTSDSNGDGKLTRDEAPAFLRANFGPADIDRDGFYSESEHKIWRDAFDRDSELMLIEPAGSGDLTATAIRWRAHKNVPEVPMPLGLAGHIYTVTAGGIFTSHDAATGAVRKRGRLEGALGAYFASPVAGDEKIYIVSQEGKLTVLRPGAEWEILAVNDLGDECYATPVLDKDRIFVRTAGTLYGFRSRQ